MERGQGESCDHIALSAQDVYASLMQTGFCSEQCHTWFSEALSSCLHNSLDQCDYVYATVTTNLCSLQLAVFLKGGFNDGVTRQSQLSQLGPCVLSSMLKSWDNTFFFKPLLQPHETRRLCLFILRGDWSVRPREGITETYSGFGAVIL